MKAHGGSQNAEPGANRFYRSWATGKGLCAFGVTVA